MLNIWILFDYEIRQRPPRLPGRVDYFCSLVTTIHIVETRLHVHILARSLLHEIQSNVLTYDNFPCKIMLIWFPLNNFYAFDSL